MVMPAHARAMLLMIVMLAAPAAAQWDPAGGEFGKTEPTDVRVMTWNVEDGINSEADKSDDFNAWSALVRVVAAMRPDVIVIQEAGDRPSGGADSVADLETTFDLFINGGHDPFNGGQVGVSVTGLTQSIDPDYELPHVYVSSRTDGFNRNAIVSRYPFADLNGDEKATIADMPFVVEDEWAAGGNGGIRGVPFAEINLPDETHAGDLVVACAHLKAFGDPDSVEQRQIAARNLSYYIHYFFNGAGTGEPDPNDTIFSSPEAEDILAPDTPVVFAGDLNEDEQTNGRRGPAAWLATGGGTGGDDGTDRDETDAMYDDAADPFSGDTDTRGGSKLDYIIWQDSVAPLRRAFVFNSSTANADGEVPAPVGGFNFPPLASGTASDHFPVIADLQIELAEGCPPDVTGDGMVTSSDFLLYIDLFAAADPDAEFDGEPGITSSDFLAFIDAFAAGCP